jgi:acetyl coenzyme A synthetase (ADP forming)-like protein
MSNANGNIKYLFEPRSVAVIGASYDENKIGFKILQNIVKGGYKGLVYPINPQAAADLLGKKVYKSVEDIEGDVDAVSIVVPAKFVLDSIKSCVRKKVKHAMIITSGFSEAGNIELEKAIVDTAIEGGLRILGPNIFGLFSSASSFNSTFSATSILPGHLAIITQSGALGIAMIGKTAVEKMGLSAIVSVGNKADIDEADLLDYIVPQEATKVILLYIEGVRGGEKFVESIRKASRIKPVIVIKSGRSQRGAMAAASHTGSLAGSDEVFNAIIKQCGALRAESLDEAFNWCKFLVNTSVPQGDNSIIITNGGGVGVMATDACEKYGIGLYDDNVRLKEIFSSVTPAFGSTRNPIDITGGATSADYSKALDAAAKNENIDSTIALYCETATFDSQNLVGMVQDNYKAHVARNKPVVFSLVGGEATVKAVETLRAQNVPVFPDVYEAVSCLGSAHAYRRFYGKHPDDIALAAIDDKAIKGILKGAYVDFRTFLLANEGQAVMNAAGIQIPHQRIAHNINEAVESAESIGYPVVMKVVSRDILHKSCA